MVDGGGMLVLCHKNIRSDALQSGRNGDGLSCKPEAESGASESGMLGYDDDRHDATVILSGQTGGRVDGWMPWWRPKENHGGNR